MFQQTKVKNVLRLYFDEPCTKQGLHQGTDLRRVHRQLVEVMDTLNNAYSLGALIITISCRILITVYLYRWIISDFLTIQLVYAYLTFQRIFYLCYRFESLKEVVSILHTLLIWCEAWSRVAILNRLFLSNVLNSHEFA